MTLRWIFLATGCLACDHCRTLWTGDEAQIGRMHSSISACKNRSEKSVSDSVRFLSFLRFLRGWLHPSKLTSFKEPPQKNVGFGRILTMLFFKSINQSIHFGVMIASTSGSQPSSFSAMPPPKEVSQNG